MLPLKGNTLHNEIINSSKIATKHLHTILCAVREPADSAYSPHVSLQSKLVPLWQGIAWGNQFWSVRGAFSRWTDLG